MRRFATLLLLAFAGGCGEFMGPDRGDPAQYAFSQEVHYACGAWAPGKPAVALGLFDIIWGRSTEEELDLGPSTEQVSRVVAAGGTIVHRYNLIMVRAIVPLSAIPGLGANAVRGVTEPGNLNTKVAVGFRTQIDQNLIVAVGGTVTRTYSWGDFLSAVVPDAAIPLLRRNANVRYVENNAGTGCFH